MIAELETLSDGKSDDARWRLVLERQPTKATARAPGVMN
jgi:hypothetical protein